VQGQRGNNVLVYDVICDLDIIDTDWETTVTVTRDGQEPITFTMPLPTGTTEDAMAAVVADDINREVAAGTADVEEVPDGPDRIVLSRDAMVGATATRVGDPTPKNGHIKTIQTFQPPAGATQNEVATVTITVLPFQGAGFISGFTVTGEKAGGTPYLKSATVQVQAGDSVEPAAQKIVDKLLQNGFDAELLPPATLRVRTTVDGPTITDCLVSIEELEDPDATVPPSYGIEVDHALW